ncbi:MAG TPA: nickel transporter permease [Egibacteraceae bacterium]|jgi:peptide/nickel transport system permease protein|nr:nickel transporter permease [Egibacteraceae bacterium]
MATARVRAPEDGFTEPPVAGAQPRRRPYVRRFFRDRLAMTGLAIVVAFGLAAVFAPALSPHDPNAQEVLARLAPPSLEHPLGTDHLGRDMLSRLLYGTRWSLGAAVAATLLVLVIGLPAGLVAGYYGGLLDTMIMRLVDVLLALPPLVIALAVVGTLGPGVRNVMIALVGVTWVLYARVVRGLALSLRDREYAVAARALGASNFRIMSRHIVPNMISPVLVLASLQTGKLLLALAALGFFGLGVQPPTPEWGTMLNQGRAFLTSAPQLMIYPGAAITLVVLGFNLLGDGLRDVFDPRLVATGR